MIKSVSNVMWKWTSHGNAWHATHGKTKKVSQRTTQVRNAAFIVFARHAKA